MITAMIKENNKKIKRLLKLKEEIKKLREMKKEYINNNFSLEKNPEFFKTNKTHYDVKIKNRMYKIYHLSHEIEFNEKFIENYNKVSIKTGSLTGNAIDYSYIKLADDLKISLTLDDLINIEYKEQSFIIFKDDLISYIKMLDNEIKSWRNI